MNMEDIERKDGQVRTNQFTSYADRVSFEATGPASGPTPRAELYRNDSEGKSHLCETYPAERDGTQYRCSFWFDPISLQIYQNALSFFVIFRDFEGLTHFSSEEHTESAGNAADTVSAVFTDASGCKCVSVLQPDRVTQVAVPVIPGNVLFMGNSILLGMQGRYGMCAGSPEKDYYYHVCQDILAHNPDCRFSKLYGSPFEHSSGIEEFEAWWSEPNWITGKPTEESFTPDLDLIILQTGDNVNTPQKLANFLVCAPILLERIKARCPKARILWVHGWYNGPLTSPAITRLCEEWRLERVDLISLRGKENQSYSGAQYVTADGTTATVQNLWITHPGDLGMRRIADKILDTLSL